MGFQDLLNRYIQEFDFYPDETKKTKNVSTIYHDAFRDQAPSFEKYEIVHKENPGLINSIDSNGNTPIMVWFKTAHAPPCIHLVSKMIENGASLHIANKQGLYPLDIILHHRGCLNTVSLIELLLDHHASFHINAIPVMQFLTRSFPVTPQLFALIYANDSVNYSSHAQKQHLSKTVSDIALIALEQFHDNLDRYIDFFEDLFTVYDADVNTFDSATCLTPLEFVLLARTNNELCLQLILKLGGTLYQCCCCQISHYRLLLAPHFTSSHGSKVSTQHRDSYGKRDKECYGNYHPSSVYPGPFPTNPESPQCKPSSSSIFTSTEEIPSIEGRPPPVSLTTLHLLHELNPSELNTPIWIGSPKKPDSTTPLQIYVNTNPIEEYDLVILSYLLRQNADVNYRDQNECSILDSYLASPYVGDMTIYVLPLLRQYGAVPDTFERYPIDIRFKTPPQPLVFLLLCVFDYIYQSRHKHPSLLLHNIAAIPLRCLYVDYTAPFMDDASVPPQHCQTETPPELAHKTPQNNTEKHDSSASDSPDIHPSPAARQYPPAFHLEDPSPPSSNFVDGAHRYPKQNSLPTMVMRYISCMVIALRMTPLSITTPGPDGRSPIFLFIVNGLCDYTLPVFDQFRHHTKNLVNVMKKKWEPTHHGLIYSRKHSGILGDALPKGLHVSLYTFNYAHNKLIRALNRISRRGCSPLDTSASIDTALAILHAPIYSIRYDSKSGCNYRQHPQRAENSVSGRKNTMIPKTPYFDAVGDTLLLSNQVFPP